ncbi:uncharacterized protein RCC_00315 [Ramularia collo-cygni]|uniref:Uncharacterized protein n=1 Tax=Ramularia collo-cygni TaxID=112498 RepID=A0A2D3UMV7_9PEZI|nr:uncharacterized protein RCC_00315 [Ramularia collo-cygni]CZT14338.1 uncharacterized protein RCC_00315 [Ramularia collo-cygni]
MERQYLFIDGVHAKGVTKRATRSHVMKGKNVGRKLFRRSKQACAPLTIAKSFGYLGISLPVEIEPWSQQIINHFFEYTSTRLYPINFGIMLQEVMVMYLRTICVDETVHACCVSMMQACNEIFSSNGESSPKALNHISRNFDLIQRRIDGDDALSDSTLAIVVSLFHQEQIRKQYAAARVHMNGLQRMVKLRGGISKLESSPYLLLKTCKIDIMFALQSGQKPMFFRDNMAYVRNVISKEGMSLACTNNALFERYSQLDSNFQDVLVDIAGSCSLFNEKGKDVPLGMIPFLELIISICYRLLRFRPLQIPSRQNDSQGALHLGSTIVMMTVFLQLGHLRMIDYTLISRCLQQTLTASLLDEDCELYLWLAVIGSIWTSGSEDSSWIIARVREASDRAGLKSWTELRGRIAIFPWIHVIHDLPGYEIWQQ